MRIYWEFAKVGKNHWLSQSLMIIPPYNILGIYGYPYIDRMPVDILRYINLRRRK